MAGARYYKECAECKFYDQVDGQEVCFKGEAFNTDDACPKYEKEHKRYKVMINKVRQRQ